VRVAYPLWILIELMILFLHLRQILKYQTRQKENHFNVTLLNFSFLSEAKTCPPLKTEKRKLPGFPLQSFAGWAGIPTPPLSEALNEG